MRHFGVFSLGHWKVVSLTKNLLQKAEAVIPHHTNNPPIQHHDHEQIRSTCYGPCRGWQSSSLQPLICFSKLITLRQPSAQP